MDAPDALKSFESNIKKNETVTLLNDPDQGGLKIDATGVQVDPRNANTVGIGQFTINSGDQAVTVKNNNTVSWGSQNLTFAQLKAQGPTTLSNGASFGINSEIDGAGGQTADRFSFQNGEYKVTAAVRSPHPDSTNYIDMNFEEKVNNAADNATGYKTTVSGQAQQVGIAELLRLEPGMSTVA